MKTKAATNGVRKTEDKPLPAWPKNPSRYFKIKDTKNGWKWEVSGPVLTYFERIAETLGCDTKTAVNNWFEEAMKKVREEAEKAEMIYVKLSATTLKRLERVAIATGCRPNKVESFIKNFIRELLVRAAD